MLEKRSYNNNQTNPKTTTQHKKQTRQKPPEKLHTKKTYNNQTRNTQTKLSLPKTVCPFSTNSNTFILLDKTD
jgi:hypothetical protein